MRAVRLLLAAVAAISATPVLAQTPPAEPWIAAIPNLTPLVATYGVYAISLIFIFFAWRRATADLKGATTETRAHLKRTHTAVVSVTLGLALIATAVWIYDTFFFNPPAAIAHVRGVVQGLTSKAGSRAYQAISVRQPPDTDFYYLNDAPPGRSEYQYKWALFTREPSPRLSFDLQHLRETTKRSTAPDLSTPTLKTQTDVLEEGWFALKLDPLVHPPGKVVEIVYEPGDTQDRVGKIFVKTGEDGRESIAFQPRKHAAYAPAAQPWASYLLAKLLTPVHAQIQMFENDGDYERQVGVSLRQQLGSNSLQTQLAARALLIQNGALAFKFISDSLEPAAGAGVDRALLVHNLSEALADIERGPDRFPAKGYLKLALAQYDLANYEASSRAFDRAGRDALGSSSLLFLKRGYAYQKSNRPKEAQADYEQSISKAGDPYAKAIAHNALATLYLDTGRHADAEREYNAALKLDRRVLGIQNNLAYSYAERGVKLDEALKLIDVALNQDGENGGYLDTKGWVLYKQGKFKDALHYLERAQKLTPGDGVIDDHVRQARAALAKKP